MRITDTIFNKVSLISSRFNVKTIILEYLEDVMCDELKKFSKILDSFHKINGRKDRFTILSFYF